MRVWLLRAAVLVLVLAVGIAIGAGPLQRSNSERDRQLAGQKAEVARQRHRVEALQSTAALGDAFAAANGPVLVRSALAGRSVAVVTLPGADPAVVAKLRADVEAAQGRITTQVDFDPRMGRSSSRQLVEALTSQMVQQAPDVQVPADAGGYERFGLLLARAIGTGPSGAPAQAAYDPTAVAIMSGLQTAELVTAKDPVTARAGLALVVTGPEASTASAAADNAVPATVLKALGQRVPTVVVGPTGAAGGRGVLGKIRGDASARAALSTVDSSETTIGQLVAVLALGARARGTIGQYGAVHAANGVMPAPPG